MIIGEPSVFAIESEITKAFEKESLRGLGFFVIHVMGRRYGVKAPNATMLAVSFDEVGIRLTRRGKHTAPFSKADATDIAKTYTNAVYLDHDENETYFGMSEARFTHTIYSSRLVLAPDGDEAFDDGSYILQFDLGNQVRIIAFTRPNGQVDSTSLRDVWLTSDIFYDVLRRWRQEFLTEWESLPKGR